MKKAPAPSTTAPNKRMSLRTWLLPVIGIVSLIALAFLIWQCGGGSWADDAFLNVTAWYGALISLLGVVLAYVIFRRQDRDSKAATSNNGILMAELRQIVAGIDQKVDDLRDVSKASELVPDDDATTESNMDDLWANTVPSYPGNSVRLSDTSGTERALYLPGQVPLSVLGALVKVWRERGMTGKWTLDSLRGAFRATGKGNHPWFLVFVPPDSAGNEPVVWKVTRGPNDTDNATKVGF